MPMARPSAVPRMARAETHKKEMALKRIFGMKPVSPPVTVGQREIPRMIAATAEKESWKETEKRSGG